jgi:hypothetical protein
MVAIVLVPVYKSDFGYSGLPLRPATLMHNSCTAREVLTRLNNISSDLALRPVPWKLLQIQVVNSFARWESQVRIL